MMKHRKLLLGLLLLLGVGFALVSATLLATGNVKIATNNANFDVKFTKAVLDETDISETAISADGKTITFGTNDLTAIGDVSKLDFEVTNNSEMYDAEVSIDCAVNGTNKDHYEITKEVANPIVGKTKGVGKVEVSLLKASVNDFSETFTCTLSATAKERTSKAEEAPLPLTYTPKYFAFGDPTTASTQDYTTLKYTGTETQAGIFMGLDADGIQKSVCTLYTGSLECFKGGAAYEAEEREHLQRVFGESNCTIGSYVECFDGNFRCTVSGGGVLCSAKNDSKILNCQLKSDGSSSCG